ncbi:fructosamine kinase family protein [Nocardia africana]|uniref:Fructosamine-3-kinase n=1 Tax=Nocardia africana TaxID=134964 RepID=A0A378WV75_9NOCA|nr:fructosamine kinase family protein [Nocardia africana]MCC3313501.1 fructosamine kinase family protein [Nocardia africana]SUA45128.1 Fructosamine-3-kinase [Nocardia africana]
MSELSTHLESLLGVPVVAAHTAGRGHAWTLYRVRLADGRDAFVKSAVGEPGSTADHALTAEAAGLRWLREADAAGLIPQVLGADDRTLVLPWLDSIAPTRAAAVRFGAALAELHTHSVDRYGAPWVGCIATVPQDNALVAGEWGPWYARYRLQPLLPAAASVLGRDGTRLVERVIDEIGDLAGPPEPPCRIHGDLWSGNLVWTERGVRLIDPAAHGGHRETDLAMLRLFGAPYLSHILRAYREHFPLSPGADQRVALHQLYPLLVHVVLFGGGYRGQAIAAAEEALSAV